MNELIREARAVQGSLAIRDDLGAGAVGAALRTKSGRVFTGVSIDLGCGIGFCAEHAAIAEMVKNREVEIASIVSVNASKVIPPCGRCRELMAQLSLKNGDAQIVLPGMKVLPLRQLLPEHWLGRW